MSAVYVSIHTPTPLAAQARVENLILLSNDKQLDIFGIERLW